MMIRSRRLPSSLLAHLAHLAHLRALVLSGATAMVVFAGCAKDPDSGAWVPKGNGGEGGIYVPPADGLTPVERHGQLSVVGPALLDVNGAPVQLKGPSSMWLNWENTGYAKNPIGVKEIRDDWGGSVVRAAMGVEPGGAYLSDPVRAKADVQAVIDNAIALGLYVIIDWHDHTAHLHRDEAIAFFTEMATLYGALPNVLYETFNEPQQISWATDVKPYHEAVVAAIRAVDPDNVIILGTPTWSQDINVAVSAPVAGTNLMYTLHFYSCTHTSSLRNRGDQAYLAGVPIFVTEWGATNSDGGTPTHPELCLEEAATWHSWMNARKISWTAWKFDDCQDQTCYFVAGTPAAGPFTDATLNGHGTFVRQHMRF